MIPLLLLLIAWWIAAGVGHAIISRFKALDLSSSDLWIYSSALGLGLAAYGVYALGILGLLSFWPVTLWWLVLALSGIPGMFAVFRDIKRSIVSLCTAFTTQRIFTLPGLVRLISILALIFAAIIVVIACFRAPSGHEWDSLAYHLADPKIYLQQHRIVSLPTEHHSNFPFTLEMLYTVGLLYDGHRLANLFHFLTAVLTVLAIVSFCRRIFSLEAGLIASLLFVTTPIVLWEASVAYIDLGLGLYLTLSILAGVSMILVHRDPEQHSGPAVSAWAALAGIMLGFALGIKYLALVPLCILSLLFLLRRIPIRSILLFLGVAVLIASPWYLRNAIVMRNPVYPYFFRIFPESRYWSADRAKPYEEEQRGFGYEHALSAPILTLQNLMLSPWRLVSNPAVYTNKGDFTFTSWVGGLYAAFLFVLLLRRRLPPVLKDLLIVTGLSLTAWFFTCQHSRYLLPTLPLLAIISGVSATEIFQSTDQKWKRTPATLLLTGLTVLLLLGQCLFVFWGVFTLPTAGKEAREVTLAGLAPTALSIPETLSSLSPEAQTDLLRRRVENFRALEWINQNTPANAGVVLYEDVHGYYLDRPYLWGNREHSSYIPYDSFNDGAQLTRWLWDHGIRYVLINLIASPDYNPNRAPDSGTLGNPVGQEQLALHQWYMDKTYRPDDWRRLLGDAMKQGLWTPVFAEHGVVVLEIHESGAAENDAQGALP